MYLIRSAIVCALAVSTIVVAAASAKPTINTSGNRLALRGYDVVAYRTEGKPLKGVSGFQYEWRGAVWRFASADHRDRFIKEPERYAPEFGGYCAYAVSRGYTADGDPLVWRIVDTRLYLNYSTEAQKLWEQDVPGNIAKGRKNWPHVLTK